MSSPHRLWNALTQSGRGEERPKQARGGIRRTRFHRRQHAQGLQAQQLVVHSALQSSCESSVCHLSLKVRTDRRGSDIRAPDTRNRDLCRRRSGAGKQNQERH